MKKILVIHGPNLNMLGKREPDVYGAITLAQVDEAIAKKGKELGVIIESFQSNHEGAIVEKIQEMYPDIDGLIINPAAYTHTSVAIRDALMLVSAPIIEVHISNIYKREAFRHKSYISDIAMASMCGFGVKGYVLALEGLCVAIEGETVI